MTEQSACLTCSKNNGHIVLMGNAEAAQHMDRYHDHQLKSAEDLQQQTEAEPQRLRGTVYVIPKRNFEEHGQRAYITTDTYESFLEARVYFPAEDFDIVWPAKQDADGFYRDPE